MERTVAVLSERLFSSGKSREALAGLSWADTGAQPPRVCAL